MPRRLRVALVAVTAAALVAVAVVPAVVARSEQQQSQRSHQSQPPSAAARAEADAALSAMRSLSVNADRVDWSRLRDDLYHQLGPSASAGDADSAISAALADLGDNHSSVEAASDANGAGEVVSFGLTALFPEGIVTALAPRGPAERAGIRIGDRLVAVDGEAPTGRRGLVTFGDPVGRHGRPRTITLTVAGGGTTHTVPVTAAPVSVDGTPTVRAIGGGRFGYVDVPTNSDIDGVAFAGDVQRGIAAADGPSTCGWVLDLRTNRGGDPFRMLAAVGPLLGEGAIGGYRDRTHRHPIEYVDGDVRQDGAVRLSLLGRPYQLAHPGAPVAVLTSRMTASAAEELVAAFNGRTATRRFGESTRGVASLNRGVDLPSGSRLWVTTAMAYDRNGQEWSGPIPPDQPAVTDWRDRTGAADPVLSAATQWLDAQPACRVSGTGG